VCPCSATGASHYAARWRSSTDAGSQSLWSTAAAAANSAAADVVWTPDPDTLATHAVRRAAGWTRGRSDAIGSWHSATDSPLSRNDAPACDCTSRPSATFTTGTYMCLFLTWCILFNIESLVKLHGARWPVQGSVLAAVWLRRCAA